MKLEERPTPETDAAYLQGLNFGVVAVSRKLERQRDEARELARELRDALAGMEEYYRQHIILCSLLLQVRAALNKAKEVLP